MDSQQQILNKVAQELAAAKIETQQAKRNKGIIEFTAKEIGYQLASIGFMIICLSYLGIDNYSLINENNQLKSNIATQNQPKLKPVKYSNFKIIEPKNKQIDCDNGLIQSIGDTLLCNGI